MPNPTAIPFNIKITLPDDREALSKLQIKQNLNKIGKPHRAFAERLAKAESKDDIVMETSEPGRLRLCERFDKV